MRCKACHYNLRNLAKHRCPECGRKFDPADPGTFDDPEARRRQIELMGRIVVILGMLLFIFIFGSVVLSQFGIWRG